MDRLQADDPVHIGPFRLLGRLGVGGMGRVYLGASPGGRKVAIKVVHRQHANDPEFRRRFAGEVAAARQVGGFHTALVVDADPGADPPWMAIAYIPGPSLAEVIAQCGPLDEAGVRALGAALAEGLAAIHACGLIHRDLKPGNVILADDGPRIIDFGIAKAPEAATALTGASAIAGTLAYMSPEQLRGQEATPESDVFALGALLAYAATGHGPFDAPSIPAILTRVRSEPPSLDPLTGDLRDIIAHCLAKDPGDRPGPAHLLARFTAPAAPGGAPGDGTPRPAPEEVTSTAAGAPSTATIVPALPFASPDSTLHGWSPSASSGIPALVTEVREGPGGVVPPPAQAPPHRKHRGRTVLVAAAAVAVAGLAVGLSASLPGKHPAGASVTTLHDPPGFGVCSLAFGPDGALATGDVNGYTYLWNTTAGQITATFEGPAGISVVAVAFGPDGALASGFSDGAVDLWNAPQDQLLGGVSTPTSHTGRFLNPSTYGLASLAFEPDGTLATTDEDAHTYLWNIATGKITATLTDPSAYAADSMAFGPGDTLATSNGSGSIYLWNIATGKITATLTDPAIMADVNTMTFGPDGILATGDSLGNVDLWDTGTGTVIATFTNPVVDTASTPNGKGVNSVAFGPNGTLAASISRSGSIYLWNTSTSTIIGTLTDPSSSGVNSVAFGPNGTLAAADLNGNTYLWKIPG